MSEESESTNTMDRLDDEIPSIFTNGDLLQPYFMKKDGNSKKCYAINGSLFEEDEECEVNGDIKEFEVHVQKVDNHLYRMENEDVYCSTPTESDVSELEDDISDRELDISIQTVPHGIIINSNVYLTNHQWHTMTFVDIMLLKCVACQMFCDLDSCQGHMQSQFHNKNLSKFKPLEKFELSITRRIRNNYHCGVCNESFNITDDNDHYASKTHEGNLLFAINKVSDLIYNVQDNSSSRIDTHNSRPDTHSPRTDAHIPGNYETRQNNNDWYNLDAYVSNNYDSCSSTSYDYEEEYNEPIKGTSYASMASKPKTIEIPKFLNIDLGTKSVKVRFESWHMIIKLKLNEFYCMVCNKRDHIRFKMEHCMGAEHVDRLAACKVVENFDDYLIRIVNDKLYHCGHCNNLQVIPDMADHMELVHPRKNKNIIEDINHKNCQSIVKNKDGGAQKLKTTLENGQNSKHTNTGEETRCSNKNSGTNTIQVNEAELTKNIVITDTALKIPDIYSYIVVCPFGYKLNIPLLSYNVVFARTDGFYCRLCDYQCKEAEVNEHIYSLQHICLIQRTPFIFPFGSNLIRAVRDYLHCAICNTSVTADKIYEHNMDKIHAKLLFKALGIIHKGGTQTRNAASKSENVSLTTPSGAQNVIQSHIRVPAARPQIPPSGAQNVNQPPMRIPVNRPTVSPFGSQMNTIPQINPQHFRPQVFQTTSNVSKTEEKSIDKPIFPKITTTPSSVRTPSTTQSTSPIRATNNTPSDHKTENIKRTTIINEPQKQTAEHGSIKNKPNLETNEPNLETNEPHSRLVESEQETNEPELETDEPELETDEPESETIEPDAETNEEIDESFDSTEGMFDTEQYVYIKLKNIYFRITNSAYNTLVAVGDGGRYCFVCATRVDIYDLKKHVDTRGHVENIEEYKFMEKYEEHLFRQIYLMYHCSICNVLVRRRDLKCHTEWPTHVSLRESINRDVKKQRKIELKSGIMEYNVTSTKEIIFLHEKESPIKIDLNYTVIKSTSEAKDNVCQTSRRNKIFILNNNVLKVTYDNWHSVVKFKSGYYKCVVCQKQLNNDDLDRHLKSHYHRSSLSKPFEKQYYPALVRQVNDNYLHCLICNSEIPNKDYIIDEHINGKKHGKNYEMVLKFSSESSSYTDCDDDILYL